MTWRLGILKVTVAAMVVGLMLAIGAREAPPAHAAAPPQLQDFDVDVTQCLGVASDPPGFGTPAWVVGGINCLIPEAKVPAATPSTSTNIALLAGNRLGLPFTYTGPVWFMEDDTGIGVGSCADFIDNDADTLTDGADPDCANTGQEGIPAGDVTSETDLFCDGVFDILASAASDANGNTVIDGAEVLLPEVFMERTTAFGLLSGPNGRDETFLTALLPGPAAMTPHVRLLADLTTLYLGGVTTFTLPNPVSLNSVYLIPSWQPVLWPPQPAPEFMMRTNTTLLAGDPSSPTTTFVCTDSPQNSQSHTVGVIAPPDVAAPETLTANPGLPPSDWEVGIYARWTTELSDDDEYANVNHIDLSTNCKVISTGPAALVDIDNDCLEADDFVAPPIDTIPDEGELLALPACVAAAGDPDADGLIGDFDADSDNDGLPDGVEVAWGSDPCVTDTDGDGRTDLEEMIGPAVFLTDPTVADTDGDTIVDGGLKVDMYDTDTDADGCQDAGVSDGIPDFADLDGDGFCDATDPDGLPVDFIPQPGMALAPGFGIQISGDAVTYAACPVAGQPAGAPPCYDDGSTHVRVGYKITGVDIQPDAGGNDNCPSLANPAQVNTDLDAATQMGGGDLYGDVCDGDDDQDTIVDRAEDTFLWLAPGCGNGPAAFLLSSTDPDTDGDGVLDGVECSTGSDPTDPLSLPAPCAAPLQLDAEGDLLCAGVASLFDEELNYRTDGISPPPGAPVPFPDPEVDGMVGDGDPDSDNDGFTDGCEVLFAGTSPISPDTDEDGIADGPIDPDGAGPIVAGPDPVGPLAGAPGNAACVPIAAGAAGPPPGGGVGTIGNGIGIAGDDVTDPAGNPSRNSGGIDNTYDDNADGSWNAAGDDGPYWDLNGNHIRDEVEGICPLAVNPTGDDDADGMLNTWEVCKWGTDPNVSDSDGDGIWDCEEAADVDGNGVVDFVGDVIAYAKSALLPDNLFGKDGDFDINGDGSVDFVGDVIQEAKFGLLPGLCAP